MGIMVKTVETKKDLEAFLHVPWKIYAPQGKRDPNWVPPFLPDQRSLLDPKSNPYHEHSRSKLFLAVNDKGEPLGRISASVDDNFIKLWNEKVGFFGWFECINDLETANALFNEAEKFLKVEGISIARGPSSFTSNDDYFGFLLKGYDKPAVMAMTYNPPYYLELAEKCGYSKSKDLYAWWFDVSKGFPERVTRIAEKIKKRENIRVRCLNTKNFYQDVNHFKEVYNKAWEKNWGFVPLTDAELNYQAKKLKDIVWPDIVIFAEVDGKVVAACLATPDINQALIKMNGELLSLSDPFGVFKFLLGVRKVTSIRLMALGIIPEYRKKGLDAVLYNEIFQAGGVRRKLLGGELSWTLEDNDMISKGIEATGATNYKSYRIYEKKI